MPATAYFAKTRAFLAKAVERISRLAGKSAEGTGAVAALGMVALFVPSMGAIGGYLRSPAIEASRTVANEPAQAMTPGSAELRVVSPAPAAAASPRAPEQVGEGFIQRFDGGALDEDRWFISDGWTNGDWMANDWRRSHVEIMNEGLRLTLGRGPAGSGLPLAGGEIRTHAEFRYGYFEVRMRTPRDPGLIIGAFTYARTEGRIKPNEIDIEILGRDTTRVELTIHENGRATSKVVKLPFDSAEGFHTYGIEWRPESVRWYADGVLIHTETGSRVASLTRPQQFILSLWASNTLHEWVGEFDPSGGPWTLDIACVAYAPVYPGAPVCR